MSHELLVKPVVYQEVVAAAGWYETRSEGLGERWAKQAIETFRLAAESPLQYPVVGRHRDIRRALVEGFPYRVLFAVRPGRIIVFAVVHAARRNMIPRNRLSSLDEPPL